MHFLCSTIRIHLQSCASAGVHCHVLVKAFRAHGSQRSRSVEQSLADVTRQLYLAEQHLRSHLTTGGTFHRSEAAVTDVRDKLALYRAEMRTALAMAKLVKMAWIPKDWPYWRFPCLGEVWLVFSDLATCTCLRAQLAARSAVVY